MAVACAQPANVQDYAVDDDSTGSPHDAWDGLAQNVVLRLSTSKDACRTRPSGNALSALDRVPLTSPGTPARAPLKPR